MVSFTDLIKKIKGANYASQIRLIVLLLLLFLVVLNVQITYLFEKTKERLSQELESRLRLAASVLHDYWGEMALTPGERKGKKEQWPLGDEDLRFLSTWMSRLGLDRVVVIPREGDPFAVDAAGTLAEADPSLISMEGATPRERVWRGDSVLTPVFRASARGFCKVLFLPQRSADGSVIAIIGLIAPAEFLGRISWVSSYLFYGFLIGIPAALVISFFFIDFVLRPYRRLSSAAPSLARPDGTYPDVDGLVATYEHIIQVLREKEAELGRLYQMEQKRSQDLENYQRYLLSSISSGVVSLDSGFRIQVCNQVARGIFGLSGEELRGKDAREVFQGMPEFLARVEETLLEGKIHQRQELPIEREGGDRSWIGLSSSLLRSESGMPEVAIFLLTDLTEIRGLQEQMRIKESLAALGEMSAGIAHEFRNYLSALLGQCRLLQRRISDEGGGKKILEEMVGEIHSLEAVIQECLVFGRPQELKIQPLKLGRFLRELEASFAESLAETRIEMTVQPGLDTTVAADPVALRQGFVNLIQNSREAMPQGGRLSISVRTPRRYQQSGDSKGPYSEGGFARISLADNGRGMDPEVRQKAFLPFFTTKETGTGLGLAMVQKAIVGMGGQIEIESEAGVGTTFHVYLPLMPSGEERGNG